MGKFHIFKNQTGRGNFKRPEGAGNFDNMDDFNVANSVALKEGSIEHEPSQPNHIVNKNYVDSVAANPEIDLFFTQDASDISTYFNLDVDLNTTTETTNITAVPGGSVGTLLAAFATKLNEEEIDAIEFLETGIYDMHIHITGGIVNRLRVFFEIYQRKADTTENLLGTSDPSDLLTTSDAEYNVHASVLSETIWTAGDRIVIKVFGTNTGAASKDITLAMEGTTTSRIDLPAFLPLSNIVRSDGMTDNRLLRGDTASHSIQDSGISIDDSDNMTGMGTGHDAFSDFVTAEHVDWAAESAGTIHTSNYVDNNDNTQNSISKSITVEDPTSSEDITIFFTERAITISEMRAVLIGSSTPSVTWKIFHHATDRNNAGNAVVTAGTTTTSTTTGSDVTSFDDATIPADSYVWLETTAKSGTVTEFHVTLVFSED